MLLKDYLTYTGTTVDAFAKRIGVKRNTVNFYINKNLVPRKRIQAIIERETQGLVTAYDLRNFSSPRIDPVKALKYYLDTHPDAELDEYTRKQKILQEHTTNGDTHEPKTQN